MAYLLEYNNEKYIYIHIPKTGGMTMGNELKHHNTISLIPNSIINGHLSYNDIDNRLNGDIRKYNVFTTIRDPWSWYSSWYHWIRNHKSLDNNTDFTKSIEVVRGNDINYFVKWVRDNRDTEFFHNNGLMTKKFQEFIDWIGDVDFVKIIRMEDMGNTNFNDEVGIPLVINSKHNVSNNTHYSRLFNDDSVSIISEMHKNDIKNFNFIYEER
jgi:hypothetical protein